MRTGRPIARLSLAVEERESLENWARRPTSAQALAQRARIVLECAAGNPNMLGCAQTQDNPTDCRQMAAAFSGPPSGWSAR
jgi:hypothetical protein